MSQFNDPWNPRRRDDDSDDRNRDDRDDRDREFEQEYEQADTPPPRPPRRRRLRDAYDDYDADEDFDRPHRQRWKVPHRGAMILSFGVAGWMFCFAFGIAAWVMGNTDLQAMREGRMDPAGESMTQAGRIIGMIQTIFVGFFVVLILALLIVGIAVGGND